MIHVSVTGETYPMRCRFAGMGYHWNKVIRAWTKVVSESSLNYQMEQLRPMRSMSDTPSPSIQITLTHIDINGNPLSDKVLRFKLKPEGSGVGTDFLALFQAEVCDVQVITNNLVAPTPPKSEVKKKKPVTDPGFF